MMTPRTTVRAVFVGALLAAGLVAAAPARADAVPAIGPDPADPAPTALDSCLDDTNSLSVLFLVDTSKSLGDTDPTDQRVTGLKAAVGALDSFRDATAGDAETLAVHVDFLSFGARTTRTFGDRPEWAPLDDDTGSLIADLDRFAELEGQQHTDYVSALSPYPDRTDPVAGEVGALDLLARAPDDSCRILVWFTDGDFDFDRVGQDEDERLPTWQPDLPLDDDVSVEAARDIGAERLCAPGGPIDGLRGGDIRSASGAQVAVMTLGDGPFDLVGRLAAGEDCGSVMPRPGDQVYAADDVDQLTLNLREVVLGPDAGPPNDEPIPACPPGDTCEHLYEFELTSPINSFNLLTLADDQVTTSLIGPDGSVVEFGGDDQVEMDNGALLTIDAFGADGGAHQVVARLPAGRSEWIGKWHVRFTAPDAATAAQLANRASIYVFGGDRSYHVRDGDAVLRHGTAGTVTVETRDDGIVIASSPSTAERTELELTAGDVDLDAVQQDNGLWVAGIEVPDDTQLTAVPIAGTASTSVRLHPDARWVPLDDVAIEASLPVSPLPKHPTLDSPIGDLGVLDQDSPVSRAAFVADATAPESAGTITFDGATDPSADGFAGPTTIRVFDADGTRLDAGDSIDLAQGETVELAVEVELTDPASLEMTPADLTGAVTFTSTSAGDLGEPETTDKTVRVAVRPIVETTSDRGLAAGLIALAVLLPLLVLWTLNWITAKVDIGRGALVDIPVRFDGGRLRGAGDRALEIGPDDLDIVGTPLPGKHRSVELGTTVVAARWPRNPFADITAHARSAGARLVVANRGTTRNAGAGRLDASLVDPWIFHAGHTPRRDAAGGIDPVDGRLVMVVPRKPEAATAHLRAQLPDIEEQLDRCIRRHAADHTPVDEPPDSDGSSTGGDGHIPADPFGSTPAGPGPGDRPPDPFGTDPQRPPTPIGSPSVATPPPPPF